MINNRYYVITAADPNLVEILNISVESSLIRVRDDGVQAIIKLVSGDTNNYPLLSSYLEYTHEQIKIFLIPDEWSGDPFITP